MLLTIVLLLSNTFLVFRLTILQKMYFPEFNYYNHLLYEALKGKYNNYKSHF